MLKKRGGNHLFTAAEAEYSLTLGEDLLLHSLLREIVGPHYKVLVYVSRYTLTTYHLTGRGTSFRILLGLTQTF